MNQKDDHTRLRMNQKDDHTRLRMNQKDSVEVQFQWEEHPKLSNDAEQIEQEKISQSTRRCTLQVSVRFLMYLGQQKSNLTCARIIHTRFLKVSCTLRTRSTNAWEEKKGEGQIKTYHKHVINKGD